MVLLLTGPSDHILSSKVPVPEHIHSLSFSEAQFPLGGRGHSEHHLPLCLQPDGRVKAILFHKGQEHQEQDKTHTFHPKFRTYSCKYAIILSSQTSGNFIVFIYFLILTQEYVIIRFEREREREKR